MPKPDLYLFTSVAFMLLGTAILGVGWTGVLAQWQPLCGRPAVRHVTALSGGALIATSNYLAALLMSVS